MENGFPRNVKSVEDARALLEHIKKLIREHKVLFLEQRPKNAQTILDLGITPVIRRQIIKELEATDYSSGPEDDHDRSGKQIAVFGYDYNGTELYIKFSFGMDPLPVIVVSFHESEFSMKYPF
jgi:hypothetical protein